jgi:hypothetical protein
MRRPMLDPAEHALRVALEREGFTFTEDGKPGGEVNKAIDFHLADYGIAIEVKQFHSDRISDQMARHENIIAVQGVKAVEFLAALLVDYKRA